MLKSACFATESNPHHCVKRGYINRLANNFYGWRLSTASMESSYRCLSKLTSVKICLIQEIGRRVFDGRKWEKKMKKNGEDRSRNWVIITHFPRESTFSENISLFNRLKSEDDFSVVYQKVWLFASIKIILNTIKIVNGVYYYCFEIKHLHMYCWFELWVIQNFMNNSCVCPKYGSIPAVFTNPRRKCNLMC